MKRKAYALLPALILLLHPSSVFAAAYPWSWGTTGVADTSRVGGILQLTDETVDNQLSMGSFFITSPWSKDGRWIVYEDATGENICTIDTSNAVSICLTDAFLSALEGVQDPSFGTDNKIYFEKTLSPGHEIWRMNSDGTGKENLTARHSGADEQYVKVSPDAQRIAFFRNNALWVANSDGTSEHKISGTIQVDNPQHSWSPNSQWIVYQGVDGSNKWIYKAKVDGTINQNLTKPASFSGQQVHLWPVWSPNGEKIAYLWSSWDGANWYYNIRTVTENGLSIQANLDSAASSSTDWLHIDGPLSWSPDAQWLSYVKQGGGDKAIFITNVEALGQKAQLTTNYDDMTPIWSPAGNRILFMDAGPG